MSETFHYPRCLITEKVVKDTDKCIYSKNFDGIVSREGFDKCKERASNKDDEIAQVIWADIKWAENDERWMNMPY